jgi:hypothetical protein
MSIHATQTVVTATAAKLGSTAKTTLYRVYMYVAATGICEFKNGATDTGDVLLTITGLTNTPVDIDFSSIGGVLFSTACFVKPTGTGNIVYCWYRQ